MKKDAIRVLVVEDHNVVRQGLVALLKVASDLEVVGEAADGEQAITQFRKCLPNVTLIDLRMPRLSGVEVIQRIRMETPGARFIVLTTYDGDEDIYRGLRAGARAYLLKDASSEQLLETIRGVHRGRTLIPPEVASRLAARMSIPDLTPREVEVLRLIASGKSNHQIGTELFITESTVKAHVNSILNKLDASDRTQAVTIGLRRGIIHLE